MVNISDLNTADLVPDEAPPSGGPAPAGGQAVPSNISQIDPSNLQTEEQYNQEKYGTTGQTILGGIEQVGQGALGPVIPALEEASGLTTGEAIRGRQEALGAAAPVLQGVGLVGSALIPGAGELGLAGAAGRVGEAAAGLLPEAAGTLAKIAATGVKTGAEMAALQTSDELTKLVTGDPNQSVQSAAINIGLSGVIGGAGGAVLGSVSPLWNKAMNKLGVEKLATDFMGETKFLNENPDLVNGASQEINDRIAAADQLIKGGLKGDLIDKLTQGITPEQLSDHVDEINELVKNAPKALTSDPTFQNEFEKWQKAVTPEIDPITLRPVSAPAANDVFRATENLKRQLQEWGQYNKALVPLAERPFRNAAQSIATGLKESLENTSTWGAAGETQAAYNKAVAPLFDIQKEFLGKFAAKEGGERVADPTKINTYLNQADKSKAGLKSNYVKNYLDQTQKVADALNTHYMENGLAQPFEDKLNPTPILDHSLNVAPSPGVNLARWAKNKGASAMAGAAGEAGAGVVGGGLGALIGHPLAGAWMGEKVLSPIFSAFAKPFAENAVNSEAAKSTVDYIGNVVKGQKQLSSATGNFFKFGSEVIGKDLIPDQESRDKLEKSLEHASNPSNLMNVAGNVGHYMPNHQTAAAGLATSASEYFAALKPKEPQGEPLDVPIKPRAGAMANYNRQLDIAQQPLMVLKHARDGMILPQDLATLNMVYPNLKNQMVSQLGQEMIKAKSEGVEIPYRTRIGMSQLMGIPVDGTMTLQSAQAVMMANAGNQQETQQQGKQRKPSSTVTKQMNKNNALYQTPEQNRQIDKRSEQ
jgi:hypothetical protein